MADTNIIQTPIIANEPYTEFKGICALCGRFIHWAELCVEDEFGLVMYHIDCDKSYIEY